MKIFFDGGWDIVSVDATFLVLYFSWEEIRVMMQHVIGEITKESDKSNIEGIQWLSGRADAKRSSGPWFETALAL